MRARTIAVAGLLGLGLLTGSAAADETDAYRGCRHGFDAAVRAYVSATDAKDVAAMERVLHPGDTIVMPDAVVYPGKEKAMEFFREFFGNPNWTQSFTPIRTVVDGCDTGFVLMDSLYAQPDGYRSHLLIGLTFTRTHGRWLVLLDQNTRIPAQ
ncbi:YybH family protein [Amycolatopsis samaneae]|uniref:YybH family protein n=1 Tax=Amycolatopsis samaneae TaxID=664691 RepID=A0ABW5GPB2_9PSEU